MSILCRVAVIAAALLLAGCGGSTPSALQGASVPASPSASPTPVGSPAAGAQVWSVPDAVRASADPGLAGALASVTSSAAGPRYAVAAIRQQGDWALVMIENADPQIASDAGFAVAIRAGGPWTVVQATDTAAFCAALAKAPAGALTADERDYFMGCH